MASKNPPTLQQSLPGLGRILRRFAPYIRQQRALIVGALAALFMSTALRLLEPWPLKFIFDRVLSTSKHKHFSSVPYLDNLDPMSLLTVCAVATVVITALRAMADYANTIGFSLIGNKVLMQVRNELYLHLQRLSLSFHSGARTGDLTVRVINDINMLKDVLVTAILPLLASTLILVGMWGMMFLLQWKLTLIALATVPFLWLSTVRLSKRIRESARVQRQREGALAATAAESLSAIKIVQSLSLEGMFAQDFVSRNKKSQKGDVRTSQLAASLERSVDVLLSIATALVLWYGTRIILLQNTANAMTPGDLLVFLTYLKRAFNPMQDFAKYTGRLAKATAAGERVLDLLDRAPDIHDLPNAVDAPALRGEIRFDNVNFSYEPEQTVLQDIDFTVQPGQHVALVGASGIGKSTLASLILRLYDPTEGRILIDGRDIRDYTIASLRSQISVVLQDSVLFAATVRDNIAYGAPDATPEAVEAAARLANAHEFIQSLPEGYDTVMGERGVTLSGGQRQRIAVARAAIRQAPILILDEPTTGLDEANERTIIEALRRLARNRTTFLISHDLQVAARADLILYFEDGRIRERGTHQELMNLDGQYAALYRLQEASLDHLMREDADALAL